MIRLPKLGPAVLAAALMLAISALAFADQMIGIGTARWNHRDDRSGAVGCITVADGNSACKLFPAGTGDQLLAVVVNVGTSGAANCAWAGDAITVNTAGNVSAGGGFGTGASAGFALAAPGARYDGRQRADDLVISRVAGMDTGFCTTPRTQNADTFYVPCRVAGGGTNCASYDGQNLGACIAPTPASFASAGLFLVCNGVVHAWIEKLIK